ncbi:MAG: glutathione peroxidase [Planctomycetota bacterium]|nr:glutathione peroxidase [Planctomycetota bacterium]MDG1985350.1 glutathione peroxidase [Planctomycetota bacterium]
MGRLQKLAFKLLRGRSSGPSPHVDFDPMTTFHDFRAPTIDGTDCSFDSFSGKVVLVVNVASRCGLTPQYAGLEKLAEQYRDRGLVVVGFPCNQFKGQEPGSAEEIKTFCSTTYGVTFPLFGKIDVNGPERHDLYAWLTQQPTSPEGPGDVQWNFGKFLIGKDGGLLGRFEPTTDPAAPDLTAAIEAAL